METITAYAVAMRLAGAVFAELALILLVAGVVITPLVLSFDAHRAGLVPRLAQHVVRVLAFVGWAFLLANPLAPEAPVASWVPALAIAVIPILGSWLFPPGGDE